jgi:hypothetical protein
MRYNSNCKGEYTPNSTTGRLVAVAGASYCSDYNTGRSLPTQLLRRERLTRYMAAPLRQQHRRDYRAVQGDS